MPSEAATTVSDATDDLTLRAVNAHAKRRGLDAHAQSVLLDATEDLSLCCLAAWNSMRESGTTAEKLFVELQRMRFQRDELRDSVEILAERLGEMDARRRPHYSPPARFRILEHKCKYMLTLEQTAQRFLVTAQTIRNWLAELGRDPGATRIGRLLIDPIPPVTRFSDGARRLIRQMKDAGFGGKKKIAESLLKLGWKADPRSVGRIFKERPAEPAPEPTPPPQQRNRPTTVRGDYPNHLWLVDITRVPVLFPFLHIHVAVALDACSRLPLAATLRFLEPTAGAILGLLQRAIRLHGRPRHLVVDQGPQFTAGEFKSFVKSQGIRIRYGAVGETHSIGLIDRFFRTLKESLGLRRWRPWSFRDFPTASACGCHPVTN